ncbi:MAG: methane monooxygenase/ammonia monooxygenase subunit C [Acidimicrobiia bacterium]
MVQVAQARTASPAYKPGHGPIDWRGGHTLTFVGPLSFIVIAAALRIWMQGNAWTIGIEAAGDAFNRTYRALFYAEVIAATVVTLWWWTFLIRKGRQIVDVEVTPEVEVRRIAKFWGLISTISVELTIMASFWPNLDGSWHQTAVRDTALTPAHIPMFFLYFPIGITLTVGTYLYGRYWLPKVYGAENGFPWSFFLLISASVTEMFQVAMNEWGHSLWITEEIFAVPFHWPFVFYGWLAAGIFALWAETIIRLLGIEAEIEAAGESGKEAVA